MDTPQVIVIGAGYAGIAAANSLARRRVQVTVINPVPFFVDRIRLHEVVAGSRTPQAATVSLSRMLDPRVGLVLGTAVHVRDHEVELQDGRRREADHVLIAAGSGAGNGVTSFEGASNLRLRVAALDAGARVRVLGAGLTGVEVATALAGRRPDLRIRLVDPKGLLPGMGTRARTHIATTLARTGVSVEPTAEATEPTIECRGFRVPTFASDSQLPVESSGRLEVGLDLSVAVDGRTWLWGAGDAAVIQNRPHLRMGCATALPLGAAAAANIGRSIRGQSTKPVNVGYAMQCVSLGPRDALIQFVHTDDSPTRWLLTGAPAAIVKEGVCRFARAAPQHPSQRYLAPKGPPDESHPPSRTTTPPQQQNSLAIHKH
ncbi:MAG: FAD-dependent oxidoreductase [Humibacillus sp.]|nr:FAD-dependent oxidoreductase [Humibacillus sp.]